MSLPQVDGVLAVGAHPDDCELSAGGTLARFARQGARVVICHVCSGSKGHHELGPEALAAQRRQEAMAAAQIIGAESVSLDVPDGELFDDYPMRRRFIELLRQHRPDLILTHAAQDYHPDHVTTGHLVAAASWFAESAGHKSASPPLPSQPAIWSMDTAVGLQFQPTLYVDITETMDVKRRMLQAHANQIESMKERQITSLEQVMEDLARMRGHQCGTPFAEGFAPLLHWKRVLPM